MGRTINVTVTQVETMGVTTESKSLDIKLVAVGITVVPLLATVVALLLLVYYKRKRSAPVNLIKPHKGSEENSYASSEHSHQQGSKYSESPEPGYDVIKPIHIENAKAKTFLPKLKSTHLDMNPTQSSEYASIEDNSLHYSENCSSHKTTDSHICSCQHSAQSTR